MLKRWLCGILCLCLLLGSLPLVSLAAGTLTGTVQLDSGYLNVRKEYPSGEVIGKLYHGDKVSVLDTVVHEGKKWHKVTDGKVTGWSSAEFIVIDYVYENDAEFEAYLTAQKFPEDYKVKLREIHAQYPKWVFNAQHLSMTWAEALAAESKALKNAVTSPEAWKSMESGAYNWSTNTYVAVDSGGWVTASPAVVAHYMDPRNFLDATYVFQFEDLKYSDAHTVEGVKAILPTRYDGYAEDLLKAAKEAKVNAYFLATRMAQEGSKIDGTFEGYTGVYNFFNIGAYAGSQYGAYYGAVTNGAIYAQRKGWTSPYLCLLGSAQEIGKGYINKGQNTLYYQKFNVAGENLYNHQYMSNVQAPWREGSIRANGATDTEKEGVMTFVIPVYKEMPETVAPLPSTEGNNNNFLDSLTVSGCTIGPTFDRYTMEYTGTVGEGVTSVTVTAKKNYADAKVSGDGNITIQPGENTIPVTVTATSGQVRTYTIVITAPGEPLPPAATPTVTADGYTLGETLEGVTPSTAVSALLGKLTVKDGKAVLCAADGKQKTDGIAATGDILQIHTTDGKVHKSYPVVIRGDVNGDGKVNSQDLRRTQRHILGSAALEGYFLSASDANGDGKVNSQDLRRAQRYILGTLDSLL